MALPDIQTDRRPDDTLSGRSLRALAVTDGMPPDLRQCVHEFGFAIVNACLSHGVKSPGAIRQLVHEIWEGARQPCQRRIHLGTVDWLLMQAGSPISAPKLFRVLAANAHAVVPIDPNPKMIAASMAEVSNFDVRCTKEEKHRRRLRAAIKAGAERA